MLKRGFTFLLSACLMVQSVPVQAAQMDEDTYSYTETCEADVQEVPENETEDKTENETEDEVEAEVEVENIMPISEIGGVRHLITMPKQRER